MGIEDTLRTAIEGRSPVSLQYATTGNAERIVHPQVLFRAANGGIYLDSYQVGGATASGERIPDWRQFDLAKITKVDLLEGHYGAAPGLNLTADKYAAGLIAHLE